MATLVRILVMGLVLMPGVSLGADSLEAALELLTQPAGGPAQAGVILDWSAAELAGHLGLVLPLSGSAAGAAGGLGQIGLEPALTALESCWLEMPGIRLGSGSESTWLGLACGSSLWSSLGSGGRMGRSSLLVRGDGRQGFGLTVQGSWGGGLPGAAALALYRRQRSQLSWNIVWLGLDLECPLEPGTPGVYRLDLQASWAMAGAQDAFFDPGESTDWYFPDLVATWGRMELFQAALELAAEPGWLLLGGQGSITPDGQAGADAFGLGSWDLLLEGRRTVLALQAGFRGSTAGFRHLTGSPPDQAWEGRAGLDWAPSRELAASLELRADGPGASRYSRVPGGWQSGDQELRLDLEWNQAGWQAGTRLALGLEDAATAWSLDWRGLGAWRQSGAGQAGLCLRLDASLGLEGPVALDGVSGSPGSWQGRLAGRFGLQGEWGRLGLVAGLGASGGWGGTGAAVPEAPLRLSLSGSLEAARSAGPGGEFGLACGLADPLELDPAGADEPAARTGPAGGTGMSDRLEFRLWYKAALDW